MKMHVLKIYEGEVGTRIVISSTKREAMTSLRRFHKLGYLAYHLGYIEAPDRTAAEHTRAARLLHTVGLAM